jgi:hypothetical protein
VGCERWQRDETCSNALEHRYRFDCTGFSFLHARSNRLGVVTVRIPHRETKIKDGAAL